MTAHELISLPHCECVLTVEDVCCCRGTTTEYELQLGCDHDPDALSLQVLSILGQHTPSSILDGLKFQLGALWLTLTNKTNV